MKPRYRTVWDLPRNDIAACYQFWLTHEITGEEWRVMLRLQDDPQRLIDAAKRWRHPPRPKRRRAT